MTEPTREGITAASSLDPVASQDTPEAREAPPQEASVVPEPPTSDGASGAAEPDRAGGTKPESDTTAGEPVEEQAGDPQSGSASPSGASSPQGPGAAPEKPAGAKTWYPYITKAQFEKFLSRLENKIPAQIDRDYVRAIIRTPSMIYRFLRGIEAMRLIDREQRPTERLQRLVNQEQRPYAVGEILRDLYGELLSDWEESGQSLSDDAMVEFFRNRTGMGRDSANKMKMFFKYLLSVADFGQAPAFTPPQAEEESPEEAVSSPAAPETAPGDSQEAPSAVAPGGRAPSPVSTEPAPEQDASPPRARDESQRQERQPPQQRAQVKEREPQQERRRGRDGRDNRGKDGGRESNREQAREREARGNGGQRNGSQPAQPQTDQPSRSERTQAALPTLNEVQRSYLQTVQSIVRVNIDGDWDEDMIKTAFDRLERLFDRIRRM